jgi:hypothetical protein
MKNPKNPGSFFSAINLRQEDIDRIAKDVELHQQQSAAMEQHLRTHVQRFAHGASESMEVVARPQLRLTMDILRDPVSNSRDPNSYSGGTGRGRGRGCRGERTQHIEGRGRSQLNSTKTNVSLPLAITNSNVTMHHLEKRCNKFKSLDFLTYFMAEQGRPRPWVACSA